MKLDPRYLRPRKARFLNEMYGIFRDNSHPLRSDVLENAIIIPPLIPGSHDSVVIDGNGINRFSDDIHGDVAMISDAGMGFDGETSDETVLFAGYLHNHWGHFITQSLSRLWLPFNSGNDFSRIIFCSAPGDAQPCANIKRVLELTGLSDKIEVISEPRRFKRVIVPEPGITSRGHVGKESLKVYDTISANIDRLTENSRSEWPGKIYLSRAQFVKSNLNEYGSQWVDAFFLKNGFTVISPEKETIETTISLIRHAGIVAAMSGTLPHNMLFANPGQRLLIIEKYAAANNFQPGIDLLRDLDVTPIDANAFIWPIDAGAGPFIIYPNDIFTRFATDSGMSLAQQWNDSTKKKALIRFFTLFHRHYAYRLQLQEWEEPEIGALREAAIDSLTDFGEWINGTKPLSLSDTINPRTIAKRIFHLIKRLR